MSHKKKEHVSVFSGTANRPPTISEIVTNREKSALDDDCLISYLIEEINVRLTRKIKHCLSKGSSVDELKRVCLSMTQLEKGLVTDAEKNNNLTATTIQNCLNRYNRKNNTNSIILWQSFINEDFTRLVEEERNLLGSEQIVAARESSITKPDVKTDQYRPSQRIKAHG
jgi:hypothetical protein